MNVLELIERAHVEVDLEREIRQLQAKLLEAEATLLTHRVREALDQLGPGLAA